MSLLITDCHNVCRRACARIHATKEGTEGRIPGFDDRSQQPTTEGGDFWQLHAEPCHAQMAQPHLHRPVRIAGSSFSTSAVQHFTALHVAKQLDLNMRSSACCIKAMRLAGQCCQGRQSCLQITPGLPGAATHYFTLHVQVTELPAKAVKAQADCMQGVAVLSKRVSWQT